MQKKVYETYIKVYEHVHVYETYRELWCAFHHTDMAYLLKYQEELASINIHHFLLFITNL